MNQQLSEDAISGSTKLRIAKRGGRGSVCTTLNTFVRKYGLPFNAGPEALFWNDSDLALFKLALASQGRYWTPKFDVTLAAPITKSRAAIVPRQHCQFNFPTATPEDDEIFEFPF